MFCWALAFGFHPTPQRASVVIGAALPKKPSTPLGQGEPTEASSAALLARRDAFHIGVSTLVLSIREAEIRFLIPKGLPVRHNHRTAGARI